MDIPAAVNVVQCAGCDASIPLPRYRDEDGWRCESCAPARRACENEGCSYADIDIKCETHETWFCEQSTLCQLCDETVPRGTFSAHVASAHQVPKHEAGSTWRVTDSGRFLLESAAGTAVCCYAVCYTQLCLQVFTPLPNERLREFRCVMKVTDPATGHTRTYTTDALYDYSNDWYFDVNKRDFPSWNTEFDVSVDIIQSGS